MDLKDSKVSSVGNIHFYGGDICYAWLPDPEILLEQQKQYLDRTLVEVFYSFGFVLYVGYYDETGLADGRYPDGQFRVRIYNTETQTVLHEWRTNDVQTLYNKVREAATLAPKLRQTKNSES